MFIIATRDVMFFNGVSIGGLAGKKGCRVKDGVTGSRKGKIQPQYTVYVSVLSKNKNKWYMDFFKGNEV